jgi:hypothetical protein
MLPGEPDTEAGLPIRPQHMRGGGAAPGTLDLARDILTRWPTAKNVICSATWAFLGTCTGKDMWNDDIAPNFALQDMICRRDQYDRLQVCHLIQVNFERAKRSGCRSPIRQR